MENCEDEEPGCGEYIIPFYDGVKVGTYEFYLFALGADTQTQFGSGSFQILPGLATVSSTVEGLSATYGAGARGTTYIYARDEYRNQVSAFAADENLNPKP